jgi:hypothetical protein
MFKDFHDFIITAFHNNIKNKLLRHCTVSQIAFFFSGMFFISSSMLSSLSSLSLSSLVNCFSSFNTTNKTTDNFDYNLQQEISLDDYQYEAVLLARGLF